MSVKTGVTFADIAASEERFQLATYKKMPIAAERGEADIAKVRRLDPVDVG